jgi:hypothetical protein
MVELQQGLRIIQCKTWEAFCIEVRKSQPIFGFGRRIFRGQRNTTWPLSSKFERTLGASLLSAEMGNKLTIHTFRNGYVERFMRLAQSLPGLEIPMTPDDWWILGRHYGLVTPLLDWTESPYIAAFFAFADHMGHHNEGFRSGEPLKVISADGQVAIWSLREIFDPTGLNDFRMIWPETAFSVHSQRIRMQQSVFTELTSDKHLDLVSYLQSHQKLVALERYEISGTEACKALRDLELMNIRFSSLFPDLGGAAIQANLGDILEIFSQDWANTQNGDGSTE